MTPATVQAVALAVLRDQGITSLVPSVAQANLVRPSDIDAVALCLTMAFQEGAQGSAAEQLNQPGSGYIQAPTSITLTATQGSTTVSALTTWASWMEGCTVRLNGDTQDNELLSQTQLARPYTGTSGSGITGTMWNDCFTLDDTVERILGPLILSQGIRIPESGTRMAYLQSGMYPSWNYYNCENPVVPFSYVPWWSYGPKPTAFNPVTYFLDTYYDPTLSYIKRRVRLSPMPTIPQAVGWQAKRTPIRVTSADIVSPLTTLVATGSTSDANANQTYSYVCDLNGYRLFMGVTHTAYAIFFHPNLGTYILASTLAANITPTAYWTSALAVSPMSTFNIAGTATGTVTVVTTDAGGGAADPGTKISMPNGWVESIFLPIARQLASGLPTFKNDGVRSEIGRQYAAAKARLTEERASGARMRTTYF